MDVAKFYMDQSTRESTQKDRTLGLETRFCKTAQQDSLQTNNTSSVTEGALEKCREQVVSGLSNLGTQSELLV